MRAGAPPVRGGAQAAQGNDPGTEDGRRGNAKGRTKMEPQSGLRLLDEREGAGPGAGRGDRVIYHLRAFLEDGTEIPFNALSAEDRAHALAHHPSSLTVADGFEFINFHTRLGSSEACEGVEHALHGMRSGGYRKVEAAPHRAYGATGVPGRVPSNAVVVFEIWLRDIAHQAPRPPQQRP